MYLSDLLDFQEFFDLIPYGFLTLVGHAYPLLLNWPGVRVNVESVGHNSKINSWHVLVIPGKDILVLSEESGEVFP